MRTATMKNDVQMEAVKGAPPAAVAALSMMGISLSDIVLLATLIYIVLQMAFLLYRWHRMRSADLRGDPVLPED